MEILWIGLFVAAAAAYWLYKRVGNAPWETQDFLDAVGRDRVPRTDWRSWEGLRDAFHSDRRKTVTAHYRDRSVRHRWEDVSDGDGHSHWQSELDIQLRGDLPEGLEARHPVGMKLLSKWERFELDLGGAAGPIDQGKRIPIVQMKADDPDRLPPYLAQRESRLGAAIMELVETGTRDWTIDHRQIRTTDYRSPSQVIDRLVDLAEALDVDD